MLRSSLDLVLESACSRYVCEKNLLFISCRPQKWLNGLIMAARQLAGRRPLYFTEVCFYPLTYIIFFRRLILEGDQRLLKCTPRWGWVCPQQFFNAQLDPSTQILDLALVSAVASSGVPSHDFYRNFCSAYTVRDSCHFWILKSYS